MYGLYKYQKEYVVQIQNKHNNKELIVQSDNRDILDSIARNLNLKIPLVQLNKDIVDNVDTPKHIFGMTNNLQIFSIEDIIKQSERNINNSFNLDCNVNPISFSLEELNDTDVVNIGLSQDIERENISNNIVSDKYYSINTNNSTGNKDNNYQNNNSTDNIKLHEDVNMGSELLCIDNFVSNDNTNEDSNNCYNENLEEEDNILTQSSLTESNNTTQNSLETWLNVSQQKICDDTNLHVDYSKSYSEKRNFCCYCKKMQSKISRHLEKLHKNEEEVKKFASLPKGNKERQKIIENLRRKGNFIFNTDPAYNTGKLIVCRRPTESTKKTACDFICCPGCKGFFTKNNLRHHFKTCVQKRVGRSAQILGRKIQGRIHECANSTLRNIVFPTLREDDITRLIRYDGLLITYANKLCIKYKQPQQNNIILIRSRLRLLGRFLQALRKINKNVTDFFSLYHPSVYDDCITTINKMADFNKSAKIYATPSVASLLGILLKQIGNLSITECIKQNRLEKKTNVENFLKLLQDDFVPINKIIEKSMLQAKHRQVQELLSLDDINLLHTFLQTNRRLAFERLNNVFTYDTWQELAQFTLISIQVFNRRRVDEIERMSINDFTNRENINGTNPDLLLSDEARKIAEKYIRFRIRGKFGKPVFVVLDYEIKNCIDLLLQYRKKANIPEENPYIFALPGYNNKKFKFIKACDFLSILLTRMQSRDATYRLQDANFSNHIATRCVTSNLSEHDITQLANYLGNEAINEIILMQLFCHSTNIPRIETFQIENRNR